MSDSPHNPTEIEFRARTAILGYLVAQLFNTVYRAQGRSLDEVKEQHRNAMEQMKVQASQTPDSAQARQLKIEMEKALNEILQMIEQLYER